MVRTCFIYCGFLKKVTPRLAFVSFTKCCLLDSLYAVAGLVESIKKHKKFKQLASYSIQCLEKVICPPHGGWEANVRAAFEHGAADDIADVCLRFATDVEVFTMSITSLKSIATVPKAVASMAASPACGQLVQAVKAYLDAITVDGITVEALQKALPALDLLMQLAQQDAAAFDAAGGIDMLLSVASSPMPGGGSPASGAARSPTKSGLLVNIPLTAAYAAVVERAAATLGRASRSKPGLDALARNTAQLIAMATLNLNPSTGSGDFGFGASRSGGGANKFRDSVRKTLVMKRSVGMMMSPGGGSGSGGGAGGVSGRSQDLLSQGGAGGAGGAAGSGSGGRDFNGHLEHAFRILDRIARSDAGRDALLAAGATQALSSNMSAITRNRHLEGIVMRVLGRLLGSNIPELIARIGGGDAVDLRERVLCARLLASMTRDEEYVAALLAGEGSPLLRRIIDLATTKPLVDTEACVALLQVLRRVADASTDHIVTLEALGTVSAVVATLGSRISHASTVAEAVGVLSALIDSSDMVETIDSVTTPGSGLQLSLRAFSYHHSDEAVALACLSLIEKCIFFDYDAEKLTSLPPSPAAADGEEDGGSGGSFGAIDGALRCMADLPDSMPVQLLATDVLVYLASSADRVTAMVDGGVLSVLIRNLKTLGGNRYSQDSGSSGGERPGSFRAAPSSPAGPSGMMGSPSKDDGTDGGAGRSSESASGEDGTGVEAGHGVASADHALSAQLVASSLYLVTSLCALPSTIALAKELGIIRAVLAGFSKHSTDSGVYKNFREVISALAIEEGEVTDALSTVWRSAAKLQEVFSEESASSGGGSGSFKHVADYLARLAAYGTAPGLADLAKGGSLTPTDAERRDPTLLADAILEGISLLEAVTVSPVFVCIIAAHDGVPALLRALGVVSVIRHVSKTSASASGKASSAHNNSTNASNRSVGSGGGKGVAASVAEEVLSRTCNTLAHMARVGYEIEGGQVEADPDYPDLQADQFGVSELLYDRGALELTSRAMQSCARPSLKQFALASVTLLSWLASGHTQSVVRDHVERIVSAQGIEACVAMLRAHQGSVEVCSAVAGALTRIAVAAKGATAVATRGGSRQIIRMLHSTAALRSNPGDELLLAYLRLMDTCAAGGPDSADILRRQGLVDAVVACVDAGTQRDYLLAAAGYSHDGGEEGGSGGGAVAGVKAAAATKAASAPAAAAGASSESRPTALTSDYVPNPEVRADIDATVTSIFSRLVGPEMVRDTVATLQAVAKELKQQTGANAGYSVKKPLSVASYHPGVIVRSIVRLGLLATTEAGSAAGAEVLEAGASACVTIAEAALGVARAAAAAGLASPADVGAVEAELDPGLPASIRTVRQVTSVLFAIPTSVSGIAAGKPGNGTSSAVACVPVLFTAMAERADVIAEALASAAVISTNAAAASAIPSQQGGTGLESLCQTLRDAGDRGDEPVARDTLLTLANVACIPSLVPKVIASGAPGATESWLVDGVQDASAATLAGAFLLLAHVASDVTVCGTLLGGPIFDLMRIAVQRHCSDPYTPREPLLHALGLLLQRLAVHPLVVKDQGPNGRGEEFRNALRRVLKAAASSTGYIDSARCACAVMDAITVACTRSGAAMPSDVAAANKEAAVGAEGEDLIVQFMSSSGADDAVLASGAAALNAIGNADRAARLVADIDAYAQRIPEWLDAGYEGSSPTIVDLVSGMSDCMKTLASSLVCVGDGSPPPDVGTPYAEVLSTIWRATAVLCRDDMASVRSTPSDPQPLGEACGKDLHTVRADCLAVSAQIAGRLAAAALQAQQQAGSDPSIVLADYDVALGDLVSVLYTILAATHTVLEVRTVESLARAADLVCDTRGDEAVLAMCRGKVIAGLISLLQVVQDEASKARLAAAAGGGMGGELDPFSFLPVSDAAKCEATVSGCLKGIVAKVRSALGGSGSAPLLSDEDALADMVQAAAITSAPAASLTSSESSSGEGDGGVHGGEGSSPAGAAASATIAATAAVYDEPASSELQLLCDAVVARAAPAAWSLVTRVARKISEAMAGPAKRAALGRSPVYTVATLQADSRTLACLLKALRSKAVSGGGKAAAASSAPPPSSGTPLPATSDVIEGLLASLTSCLDVSTDASGKGRANALAGKLPAMVSKDGKDASAAADTAEGGVDSRGTDVSGTGAAEGDEYEDYVGTEAEMAAAKSIFGTAAAVANACLKTTLDLLSRTDIGPSSSAAASAASAIAQDTSLTSALAFLVTSRVAVESGAAGLALAAISRLSDLYASEQSKRSPSPPVLAARVARLQALGSAGVYKHALVAVNVPGAADSESHVLTSVTLVNRLLALGAGVPVQQLGLDKTCLLALQSALKRWGDNAAIVEQMRPIIRALENIYQEQSGGAFVALAQRVIETLAGCEGMHRHVTSDGQMFYSNSVTGETTWEPPAPVSAFMDALMELDLMARKLEDDGVPSVEPDVMRGLADALAAHQHDRGVVGVLLSAIGKFAANGENHAHLDHFGVMQLAVTAMATSETSGEGDGQGHIADPRVCEGLASIALPLSFDPSYVKTILAEAAVIPQLVAIIKRYCRYVTNYFGSPLGWSPEHAPDYNDRVAALQADGQDAEERNKPLPRLAQMCVQSLANLACDNEPDESGQSSVTRIVECGGIEALGELMSIHSANPRMLEDAICALSNMAFVSDTIQLSIGRSCMDTVCGAATSFNSDSYLFQMTLRAIGNLTRCDENIMRAVGFGVIRGMVDGMAKHADDPAVLQLCADVIGNMASVDDKKVPREEGMKILRDCSAKRTNFTPLIPAPPPKPKGSSGPAGAVGGPTPPPPRTASSAQLLARAPSVARMPTAPPPPGSSGGMPADKLVAMLAGSKSLKEAVCSILYEDGGARALVTAMINHIRNPDLAASCLRALHYIGASMELVARMTSELRLVDQVVFIMRSIDYRADVLRRGARVLGLVVGTESRSRTPEGKEVVTYPLRDRVLEAGAPAVLLGAIETHQAERDLCISCYSVLAMSRSPAVVTAVQEMGAVDTAVAVLRSNSGDGEYVGVLLELLWGWAGEHDLAQIIADRATPALSALMQAYAVAREDRDEKLQHLNYLLNLGIALVRQKVAPEPLLAGGLVAGLQAVVDSVISNKDGSALLSQRPLVLQAATILQDIVRPPTGSKDIPAMVNPAIIPAVIANGAGPLLERILRVYKAVPDPKNPKQVLLDQSMCNRVVQVLQDLMAAGYTPLARVSADPDDVAGADLPSVASTAPGVHRGSDASAGSGIAPRPPPPRAAGPPGPTSSSSAAAATPQPPARPFAGEPLDAPAMVAALRAGGRVFEVWHEMKPRRARVAIDAQRALVVVTFEDGLGGLFESVPLAEVRVVNEGLYAGFKKNWIGRNPKPSLCVSLEQAPHHGGNLLLLIEAVSEIQRHVLAQAFCLVTNATMKVTS